MLGRPKSIVHRFHCLWDSFCTSEFLVSYNIGSLAVKDFLRWVYGSPVAPKISIVEMVTKKRPRRTPEQFMTSFGWNEDWVLKEPVIEQVQKALRALFPAFMYTERYPRVWHLSFRMFRDANVSARLLNLASFLRTFGRRLPAGMGLQRTLFCLALPSLPCLRPIYCSIWC